MMNTRDQIVKTLAANSAHLEANMADFWRGWAQDLIKAGLPAKDVVDTMLSVAATQCMQIHGATYMADSMRTMADCFQLAADNGHEFCARAH